MHWNVQEISLFREFRRFVIQFNGSLFNNDQQHAWIQKVLTYERDFFIHRIYKFVNELNGSLFNYDQQNGLFFKEVFLEK